MTTQPSSPHLTPHHNTYTPSPYHASPEKYLTLPTVTKSADSFLISDRSPKPCLPASEHTPTLHWDTAH